MNLQLGLFGDEVEARPATGVGPVEPSRRIRALAERLPRGVRLGTSSWSFPGWKDIVFDREASERVLARAGLAAYAAHPLFRTVGLDRTFYRSLEAEPLRAYADDVPSDFRFVVKADRLLTSPLDPTTPGIRVRNPHFLDASYAADVVVGPLLEGLGSKVGVLLFQFPPIPPNVVDGTPRFLELLQRFLARLPDGPLYGIELRTPAFLTEDYADVIESSGAAHCYNVHPAMTALEQQMDIVQPIYQPALVIRWMLNSALDYETARARYEPFDRLIDEDPPARERIATTVLDVSLAERPAFVIANNKAEGSSPLTLMRLAETICEWRPPQGA